MVKGWVLLSAMACAISQVGVAAPMAAADAADTARAALQQRDLNRAGTALQQLVEARLPAKETGRPDPLLDRLYAEILAASGQVSVASAILERIVADPSTPDLPRYRLLLASYQESVGEWDAALDGYRRIAADPKATAPTAVAAALGLARIQMTDDPEAALATLTGLDRGRVPRDLGWEVDLLVERAASMAGPSRAALATAALERSWAGALDAAIGDAAVARISQDRALASARAGDRKTMVALLAVDRTSRQSNFGQAFVAHDLPICGTDGITADDVVVIDVVHQAAVGRPAITLAWASRKEIARPFLAGAGRSEALTVPGGQAAQFSLRCRSVPSPDYAVHVSIIEDLSGWMTGRGVYPEADAADGDLASVAARLARREARYGPNSAMLLPALLQLTGPQYLNLAEADGRRQAAQNIARITAILRGNGAPKTLVALYELSAIGTAVMAQTKTAPEGQAQAQTLLASLANDPAAPLDTLYALASGAAAAPNMPSGFKGTMLTSVLDVLRRRAPAGDQRTAAIAMRLHDLRVSIGDAPGAAAAIAGIAVPADACVLSDPQPHYVSSTITANDYPGDLVFTSLTGVTQTEFGLDAEGGARDPRILLSDPPYAFDRITIERLPTIRYDPARFAGRQSACRGQAQAVRWQLPD